MVALTEMERPRKNEGRMQGTLAYIEVRQDLPGLVAPPDKPGKVRLSDFQTFLSFNSLDALDAFASDLFLPVHSVPDWISNV